MQEVLNYLEQNEVIHLQLLNKFLKIPSISTDSNFEEYMDECVVFLMDYLKEGGFSHVERIETKRHPMVFAEYTSPRQNVPTVLIYGHYDVQPVDPLEEWDSDPFEPTIKANRLYARGASDDKGQVFMQLAVLHAFLEVHGGLPINVKVLIEGEEEIGSPNLYDILNNNQEKFSSDFVMISDSSMVESNQPTILYGLKGFLAFELIVEGPTQDLHSGVYGGAVKNPAFALTEVIQSLKNPLEQITIPHFYDDVVELLKEERQLIRQVPEEDYLKTIGITETVSESGYTSQEHTMARPTLEINGITSGYQGEGSKTIIPKEARAKITCRLVPNQNPKKILQDLETYIQKIAPKGVTVTVEQEELSAKAVKIDPSHPYIQQAAKSYSYVYGKETVFVRMGGSIPVVEWFDSLYNVPIVLLGFGTPDDQIHAPNESFSLTNFKRGMQTLAHYWYSFNEQ